MATMRIPEFHDEELPSLRQSHYEKKPSPPRQRQDGERSRPSPLRIEQKSTKSRLPEVLGNKSLVSPTIIDKVRQANWKKISKMLILARDQQDMAMNTLSLESENINSVNGTKRFLEKVENDIGLQKMRLV